MDLRAFNAYSGMNAMSQYAPPASYELCGKSFIIMRGADYGNGVFPGITFAAYPEMSVTIDGASHPYCAMKVTDDLIFAAFMIGTEVYAALLDPGKSVTPERLAAENNTMNDPGRPVSPSCFVDIAKSGSFSFGPPESGGGDADLAKNVVEWTFAPDTSVKFDYAKEEISLTAPNGMPFSVKIDKRHTMRLADGIYFQALPAEVFGQTMWVFLTLDFNRVKAAGALCGSGRMGAFLREIGGYGKVLEYSE